jgi:hypothetical protein
MGGGLDLLRAMAEHAPMRAAILDQEADELEAKAHDKRREAACYRSHSRAAQRHTGDE